ncbi:MAG: FAD binding domain-containing protein [Ilumatobacter sp.]|uniref:FAD binding domain-containing protein n=1 Tax=Ilumatobacter sp. TaxID=1967498 RepID=UPI00391AA361
MKAPPFIYHRPDSLDDALALLAEHGDEAKILAGGQSLVPLMALRMGRPAHVVDIGGIAGLDAITVGDDDSVTLGPLVRHATAERSTVLAEKAPLVHETMPWIAHRAIRTQGTVLGSIAHGDLAAEMPAVVLATGATLTATSIGGERIIAADEFFEGYLDTALRSDEILTAVTFPTWAPNSVGSVTEVARRHGDYALVGLALRLDLDGDTIVDAALAYFGAASTAIRVPDAEATLVGSIAGPDAFDSAAQIVAAQLEPPADIHGTTAYRKHLAGVLTRRGLRTATSKIGVLA